MLVVDETPALPELLKVIGDINYDIKLEKANSPNDAIELLKNIASPSVIWSNNEFENSSIDGKNLLKSCSKISPLSSRILFSPNLTKVEMDLMIRSGEIHSYYINPCNEVNPISSAIKLGIEFHKINLVGNFIDLLDFKPIKNLNKTHKEFLNLEKKIGWVFGGARDWIDIETKRLELNQLARRTQSISNKVPIKTSELLKSLATLKKKKDTKKQKELIKQIGHYISFIDDFLIYSKQHLKNSLTHVAKTNINIANTKDKIKRLKDDFFDE